MKEALVAVLKFGEVAYAKYTVPLIKDWCKRHGYDLEFHDPVREPGDYRPRGWDKLILPDIYHGYRWYILMDLDMMPSPWADSLRDYQQTSSISMARDLPQRGRHRRGLIKAGANPDYHEYNTGLIVAHNDYTGWLHTAYHTADWKHWLDHGYGYEQEEINQRIGNGEAQVRAIDGNFNRMRRVGIPRAVEIREHVQIWHLAGARNDKHRILRARKVAQRYEEVMEEITVRKATLSIS